MVRRELENGWLLINQHNHGKLAGTIIEHWGNQLFEAPDPFEEVIYAVREHDSGWQQWDKAPKICQETHYPANFLEMTTSDQRDIWSRSFSNHSKHDYASALIALHFSKFNKRSLTKNPNDPVSKALEKEINGFVSDKLRSLYGNGDELPLDMQINLKLVQAADIISLALCHGWNSVEITDVPKNYKGESSAIRLVSDDSTNFVLDPYPFCKSPIRVSVTGKILLQKTFESDEQLRLCYKKSKPKTLEFTIHNDS